MEKIHSERSTISPSSIPTNEKIVTPMTTNPKQRRFLLTCVVVIVILVVLLICSSTIGFFIANGEIKNFICTNSHSDSYLYQQLKCNVSGLSQNNSNVSTNFDQGKTIGTVDATKYSTQEALITGIVDQTTPSVVTVVAVAPSDPTAFSNGNVNGQSQNIGSGFVVRQDGIIVTNSHVVADETVNYSVLIGTDTTPIPVKQIYRDSVDDFAILKVDKTGLPALTLGNSDTVKRGNTVVAIGSPLGDLTGTVTSGIISGLNRDVDASDGSGSIFGTATTKSYHGVIQTDAPINPGNSGGPLLNSSAEVIGVNFATTSGADSISFALPVNRLKVKLAEFQTNGKLSEPFIGIAFSQRSFYLSDNSVLNGALVSQVQAKSPASDAGIQNGDLILSVNGKNLDSSTSLLDLIQTSKVGDSLNLVVWRKAQKINITVKVGDKSNYSTN